MQEDGPLETIIILCVIAFFVYIIVMLSERKKDIKKNNDELIENSSDAQTELYNYMKKNKTASELTLDKQKKKILENPEIRKQALVNRRDGLDRKIYEKELDKDREKKAKEYFVTIIDIFSTNRMLPKQFIIDEIERKFNYNNFKSIELFISWYNFRLIEECSYKPGFFDISHFLIQYNELDFRALQKEKQIYTGAESESLKLWKKHQSKSNPELLNEEDYEFKVKCDYSLLYKPNLNEKTNCILVLNTRVNLRNERVLNDLSNDNYNKSFLEILEISYKIVDLKNDFKCINEEFFNLSSSLTGSYLVDFLSFENSISSQKAREQKWNRYDILMFVYHQIQEFENVLTFNSVNTFNVLSNNLYYSCSIEKSEIDTFVNKIKKVSLKGLYQQFYSDFYSEKSMYLDSDELKYTNPKEFNIIDLNNAIFSDRIDMFSNANLLVKSTLRCYQKILLENKIKEDKIKEDKKKIDYYIKEDTKQVIDILNNSELERHLKMDNVILIKKKSTKNPKYTMLYFKGICYLHEDEPLSLSDIKLYNNNAMNSLVYITIQNSATEISDRFEIGQVFKDFAIQIIDVTKSSFIGQKARGDKYNVYLDETNLPIYRTTRLVTKDELLEQGHKILKISKVEPWEDDNLPF